MFCHAENMRFFLYLVPFFWGGFHEDTKMGYKRVLLGMQAILWICVATTSLTGCGADDSFSPEEKSHSSDYTYASAEDLSKTPCNESRDGRKAEVGSEKDIYECVFAARIPSISGWRKRTLQPKAVSFIVWNRLAVRTKKTPAVRMRNIRAVRSQSRSLLAVQSRSCPAARSQS
jgi:hypothetical protein